MINFESGKKLDKYQLIHYIGSGNFSQVWKAQDTNTDKILAVKILHSQTFDMSLLNEAKHGCRYRHKNLLEIYYADVLKNEDPIFTIIAQEFHPKGSIVNSLNPRNFMPLTQAVKFIIDILYALEYLHQNNFIHNDIKPSNILLSESGHGILADYGISAPFNFPEGTIAPSSYFPHSAPETDRSQIIHPRTDIYQVGCTLYRLLNGIGCIIDDLEKSHTIKLAAQKKAKGKIPNKNNYSRFIPMNLKRVVNKALDPIGEKRYQSARDMRRALEQLFFPGEWTIDDNGNPIGMVGDYNYQYEYRIKPKNLFDVITWKQKISTDRKTQVGRFTRKNIGQSALKILEKELIDSVLNGSIN